MIAYHHIFSYGIGSFDKDFEMITIFISLGIVNMYVEIIYKFIEYILELLFSLS